MVPHQPTTNNEQLRGSVQAAIADLHQANEVFGLPIDSAIVDNLTLALKIIS